MKFSNQFLPHVIVLVLIIVAALVCFIPCIIPYSKPSPAGAVYEGFDTPPPPPEGNDLSGVVKLQEASDQANTSASSVTIPAPDAPAAPVAPVTTTTSTTESFFGNIFGGNTHTESFTLSSASGPVSSYNEVLDKFSQVSTYGQEGVNGCVSSGLSNSKGYLCLTPDLIGALKTRGGNAQGSL
jgi:hypothetical protein